MALQDKQKNPTSRKIFQDLNNIQYQIMRSSYDSNLWMQEKNLQKDWHMYAVEQESYYAQRAHENWISMGNKNTTLFK